MNTIIVEMEMDSLPLPVDDVEDEADCGKDDPTGGQDVVDDCQWKSREDYHLLWNTIWWYPLWKEQGEREGERMEGKGGRETGERGREDGREGR